MISLFIIVDADAPTNWWDLHPHEVYGTLEKVETGYPWFEVYKIHDWLYVIYEGESSTSR